MAKTTDRAIDDVYRGDFEGFVGRRDVLAKQLRSDDDAEAADRVKALKKPSRTAWAVNQFAAHGEKLRTELLKAGAALRDAQEGLVSGDADRQALLKARDRERAAVSAAVEAIEKLAEEAGPALNAAATDRVRQTLHAVALDEDVRQEFEDARLTSDHEASGLGAGSLAGGGGAAAKKSPGKPKPDRKAEQKRRRREQLKEAGADATKRGRELEAAELELAEATKAAERAQGDLKRATKQRDQAQRVAEKATARADDLRPG